ncbi:MAG: class I SAM-dependent methyltransferase [Actinomycetota bacterium]
MTIRPDSKDLNAEVRALPWYHTIELAPGLWSPGFFDHRTTLRRVPLPASLAGKRCLDVGTHDGLWAFEMEARGAAEVVAIDLDDPFRRDWPSNVREVGPKQLVDWGWKPGLAFAVAHRARSSKVDRRDLSVYDLNPADLGEFDVVFVGSLLLHLRDPIRALEAVRSVTRETLVMAEAIDPRMEFKAGSTPAARIDGIGLDQQWWTPNRAALARMASSAGFAVRELTKPYVVRFGESGWTRRGRLKHRLRNLAVANDPAFGVVHAALRAEPAPPRSA